MRTERRLISLPDGRDLDVLTAGAAEALPLVIHEGTPEGLVAYPPTVEGHLTLTVTAIGKILDDLLDLAGVRDLPA
jgi:hypothetical protein